MAAPTEKKPFLLEFEKPLAELQQRIEQIRELAEESSVDVSTQIRQLETKYVQLRDEISAVSHHLSSFNSPVIPVAPAPSTIFKRFVMSGLSYMEIGGVKTIRRWLVVWASSVIFQWCY